MATLLITGANRGIGLAFAKAYAAEGWDVIATARRPDEAAELQALGVEVHALDAADPASIAALARALGDRPIDVMIANAGVMGPLTIDAEGWAQTLAVNTIAPTLLADALRANVAASSERKMVAITSNMGSIADNSSGGYVAYRSSKAALNAAWKSLAIAYARDGIAVAMLHPGWVKTDMGGPAAQVTVEESVGGMMRVIAGLTPDRSGVFLDYQGQERPW